MSLFISLEIVIDMLINLSLKNAHDVFLVRSIDNKYMGASKLRDDLLDVADQAVSILVSGRREAPALFRSNSTVRVHLKLHCNTVTVLTTDLID